MPAMGHKSLERVRDVLNNRVPVVLDEYQVPGVGISLRVEDTEVALGFGVTNLDHPLEVTGDTIFQIGSISKTFVGVIAAQLVELGALEIDAPVAPALADLGALDARITMRHLLTHGSGIDAQYMIGNARELLADHADDSIQASIQHFADDALMFAPGTEFSYSGPGFMVAAAVIERITGRAWADIVRERVLEPAGMHQTFTTADQAITHRVAAPHSIVDGVAAVARNAGWQLGWQLPGWDVPGGGLLSTPRELMKYARFVSREEAHLGSTEILASGCEPGLDLGYAWMRSMKRGRTAVGHDGLTIGYASRFTMIPEARVSYAILSNSVVGKPAVRVIESVLLDVLFGEEPLQETASFDPEAYAFLEGLYDCGFYGQVELRIRSDRQAFELISLPLNRGDGSFTIDPMSSSRLVPVGNGVLAAASGTNGTGERVPYVLDAHGEVTALRIGSRIATRVS